MNMLLVTEPSDQIHKESIKRIFRSSNMYYSLNLFLRLSYFKFSAFCYYFWTGKVTIFYFTFFKRPKINFKNEKPARRDSSALHLRIIGPQIQFAFASTFQKSQLCTLCENGSTRLLLKIQSKRSVGDA